MTDSSDLPVVSKVEQIEPEKSGRTFDFEKDPHEILSKKMEDLNRSIVDIARDIKEKWFVNSVNELLREVIQLKQDYEQVPKGEWLVMEKGKVNYGFELGAIADKISKLEANYNSFLKLIDLAQFPETESSIVPSSENLANPIQTMPSEVVSPPVEIKETPTASLPKSLPTTEPETVTAPPLAVETKESIIEPDVSTVPLPEDIGITVVDLDQPPSPVEAVMGKLDLSNIDLNNITEAKMMEYKTIVEAKKAEYERAQKKYDSRGEQRKFFIPAIAKIFEKSHKNKEKAFLKAKNEYEKTLLQYCGLKLHADLQTQSRSADAEAVRKMPEDIAGFVVNGSDRFDPKVGDAILGSEQIKNQDRSGKLAYSNIGLSTVKNLSLFFGKISDVSADKIISFRRWFQNSADGELTGKEIKHNIAEREEQEKEMTKISDFDINDASLEELLKMKQVIDERISLNPTNSENTKYQELGDKIDARVKELLESKDKTELKNAALIQSLDENSVKAGNEVTNGIKVSENKKFKSRKAMGLAFVSALAAMGVAESIKDNLKWWSDSPEQAVATGNQGEQNEISAEQIEKEILKLTMKKDEQISDVIEHDLRAHPELLKHYAEKIKAVNKIITDRGGDITKLSDKDWDRIPKHVLQSDLHMRNLYATESGRIMIVNVNGIYKFGTTDDDRDVEYYFYYIESVNTGKIVNGKSVSETVKRNFGGTLPVEAKIDTEELYGAIEESILASQHKPSVEDLKLEQIPETDISTDVFKTVEEKYKKFWKEAEIKMSEILDPKKTRPEGLTEETKKISEQFIKEVRDTIKNSERLDKNAVELIAILSPDSTISIDAQKEAVIDYIIGLMPANKINETRVLLTQPSPGTMAVVDPLGSHAINLYYPKEKSDTHQDKDTVTSMLVYNDKYTFSLDEKNKIIFETDGKKYLLKKASVAEVKGNEELRVELEVKKEEKK